MSAAFFFFICLSIFSFIAPFVVHDYCGVVTSVAFYLAFKIWHFSSLLISLLRLILYFFFFSLPQHCRTFHFIALPFPVICVIHFFVYFGLFNYISLIINSLLILVYFVSSLPFTILINLYAHIWIQCFVTLRHSTL